jgi:DNA-binding protein VF530
MTRPEQVGCQKGKGLHSRVFFDDRAGGRQDRSQAATPGESVEAPGRKTEYARGVQEPRDGKPPDDAASKSQRAHPKDPLHGVTLEAILEQLQAHYGWEELGRRIQVRCFTHDPSMGSSLAFLRRQPWARREVEALFIRLKSVSDA